MLLRLAFLVFAGVLLAGFDQATTPGSVNVMTFGAAGDGSHNDTAAIRSAIKTGQAVYFPKGSYRVTDMIEFQSGQKIYGDGRTESVFTVDQSFNMSAPGVLRLGSRETGATLRDIGVKFTQPETENRAEMIKYPAAITARNAARFKIDGVRVSGAWIGLDASGNTGGAYINDFENGAISVGMMFDRPLDFVRISSYHCWPFGFTDKARLKAWSDGQTIAASLARVDGLNVQGWNTFKARTVISGSTFGSMTGLNLDDDFSRIEMSGGRVTIGQVWKSTSAKGDFFIKLTGGFLNLSNFHLLGGDAGAPLVEVAAADSKGAFLTLDNGVIVNGPKAEPALLLRSGFLSASNIRFTYGGNVVREAPFVKQSGGRLSLTNSSWLDKGRGSGDAVEIATDDWHTVTGNSFVGWGAKFPQARKFGTYQSR